MTSASQMLPEPLTMPLARPPADPAPVRLIDLSQAPQELLAASVIHLSRVHVPGFFYLGRRPYLPVWALQKQIHALRVADKLPDTVLLLEHDPVYTLGRNSGDRHLLQNRPGDAEVVRTDRGGDITYHGPGQLVGYPIVKLSNRQAGVSRYLRDLERAIIAALDSYGVSAGQIQGLTGVWIDGRKVAALGVRLARWTTLHGFAINVDVSMAYFDGIVPCGILEYGVVNLSELLPRAPTPKELAHRLLPHLTPMLDA